MKYIIYEDPITHRFAHVPLASDCVDGDPAVPVVTDRWFESHDAAIAALRELLDRDEGAPEAVVDAAVPHDTVPSPSAVAPGRVRWLQH
jgi:hypothetical protein